MRVYFDLGAKLVSMYCLLVCTLVHESFKNSHYVRIYLLIGYLRGFNYG